MPERADSDRTWPIWCPNCAEPCTAFSKSVHENTERRAEFLAQVSASERNLRKAADSLAVLKGLLSRLAPVSADGSTSHADSEALASTLATLPKLSVLGWKRLCADDPLLAYVIRARAQHRFADERRGKSTKRVQECALSLYRTACEHGFTGSLAKWQELLSFRGR